MKKKRNFWIVEYQNDIKNNGTIVVFKNRFKKIKESWLFYCLLFKDPNPKDLVDFVLLYSLIEKKKFVNVETKFIEENTLLYP